MTNAICSDMNRPRDYHTKWSKSDGERQISFDTAYIQNLKRWFKWTYLQNRNMVTDVENKLMDTRRQKRRGTSWEIGFDIYSPLYIYYKIDN